MLELYNIPAGIPEILDRNRPVVVVDIFRASTSITAALASGAREIHVAGSITEAENLKNQIGPGVVMAGERAGFKIEGYDLGNSPREMTSDNVAGRPVVFNSTNGTKLLHRFADFEHVAVGSIVSLSATVKYLAGFSADPVIVCAGREGTFSTEDTIAAGLIISRLEKDEGGMDDASLWARRLVELSDGRWREWARNSFHGLYLASIGLAEDLEVCLSVDTYDFVPVQSAKVLIRSDQL